jgi:hypothetical protein
MQNQQTTTTTTTKILKKDGKIPKNYGIIKTTKGKKRTQPRKGERTTWRDQQPSKARKRKTPHKPQTEHRSQGRKPEGQGTGKTAGASHRGGANPTPEPTNQRTPPANPKSRLPFLSSLFFFSLSLN